MKIILNNNEVVLKENTVNIFQLLLIQKYSFKMLIVKINGTLVLKENYDTAFVNEGDKVDVIHLMSGG
jgi:sulfur carrier protein